MKVLHLYSGNLYGGVETLLTTLARERHLCPEMVPEFALCFEGRLAQNLRAAKVATHNLGETHFSQPWTILRARYRLNHLLKCSAYEIVICHGCWTQVIFGPVVRSQKLPLVFRSADFPQGKHWLERLAMRILPDLVITNSHFTATGLDKLYPDVECRVVYNPLSFSAFSDLDKIRSQVRDELETEQQSVVIIQTSRLERWKGHSLLLSALSQLQALPHWNCWIVGGPQRSKEFLYFEELQDQVRSIGIADRIKFWGQRQDVSRLLVAADIHCQPNTGPEPFGNAFVEALSAGLPVVTTAMGGALEIVDSSCGRLVAPADQVGLADALQDLIAHPEERNRLGQGGRIRASQLCNPTQQLNELHNILVEVVQKSAQT